MTEKKTAEEFEAEQRAIPDDRLVEMAQNALSKLCETGGRSITMTVPPHIDDTDMVIAEVIRRFKAYAAQQKSEIKKPDVDLTFWETWLTTHGYSIEFDADGLWAESWIQEHKWVDIFDLMLQFAIEQNIKMPTEEEIIAEADARFTDRITGFVHSDKRDGFIRCGRWILKLSGFATK